MRIYHTTYDGHYIVVTDANGTYNYEGLELCPDRIKKVIKKDGARQLECFADEAIKFGKAR